MSKFPQWKCCFCFVIQRQPKVALTFTLQPNLTCSHINRSASEAISHLRSEITVLCLKYSRKSCWTYKVWKLPLPREFKSANTTSSSVFTDCTHQSESWLWTIWRKFSWSYVNAAPFHNIMHNVNKAVAACQHCSRLHYGNVWLITDALIHWTAICTETTFYWKVTGHL